MYANFKITQESRNTKRWPKRVTVLQMFGISTLKEGMENGADLNNFGRQYSDWKL